MIMTPSEKYVQQLFLSRYKILLQKIEEFDGRNGQTADFEFIENGKRLFVCELKDFVHVEVSEKDGWEFTQYPDGSVVATKPSNAANRISKDIATAYDQLAKYVEPKILIFLNHSFRLDSRDLEDTYRGYWIIEDENIRIKNTYAKRASEGKIKDIKSKIDLYIWIDAVDSRVDLQEDRITFLFVSENGRKIAMDNFGITKKAG